MVMPGHSVTAYAISYAFRIIDYPGAFLIHTDGINDAYKIAGYDESDRTSHNV